MLFRSNKHGHKRVADAFGISEDVYTSDTKTKDYQTKDAEGNWVWRKRKIHPKRVTFDASKMGGQPAQPQQQDEAYKKKSAYEKINNRFKTITGRSLEDASKEWEQHRKDAEDRLKEYQKQGIINKTNEEVLGEQNYSSVHRVGITYSDPHHTAISKRKEKQFKNLRVRAEDEAAFDKAQDGIVENKPK